MTGFVWIWEYLPVFFFGREWMVADLPAVVSDLEATLVAALRRDEERAADDLACSLLNDLDIPRAVARVARPEVLLADGRAFPVVEVGVDHLVAGARNPICVPLAHAVVRGESENLLTPHIGEIGKRTFFSSVTLLARLRRWAAEEMPVRVGTVNTGSYEGVLTRATPDHLALQRAGREICLAWASVREVGALGAVQPLSLEDNG